MTFCFVGFFHAFKYSFWWGEEGGGGSCLFAALFGLVRNMVKVTTTESMKRLDVLICHLMSNHFDQKYHEISIPYVFLGHIF